MQPKFKLLDAQEIADMLGVCRREVTDRLSKRADFPQCYDISKKIKRWDADEIATWIESRRKTRVGRPRTTMPSVEAPLG